MEKNGVAIPLTATLAVQALVSMAAVTVPVFAVAAAKDVGVSAAYVGIYVGLIYIASMISSLWSGDFILRCGALRLSQICLTLCGVGLVMVIMSSVPAFIMSALILGFGYGPVTPASSHILARTTPPRSIPFVFSLKQTGVPLGGAMAGAIVPPLVLVFNWKIAAAAVGVLCMAAVLLIQPVRRRTDSDRQSKRPISLQGVSGPLRMVILDPPLRRLATVSFFFAGMQWCLATYLVIYLTKDIGMTLIKAGLILSTAQLAGTVGRVFWGFVAARFFRAQRMLGFLGVAMSLGAIATACITPAWPHAAIWSVAVLFGATAIGWNGVFLAEAARLSPEGRVGTATGGTLFFTFLGVVSVPPLFTALVETTGSYPLGYVLLAAVTFICGITGIFSCGGKG